MTESSTLRDLFEDDTRPGGVVGGRSPQGIPRGGVDAEKVIGIDHGALRIQPLTHPGWGRAGVAYGPFPRENGLAFAVHLLNGHNTSQTGSLNQSLLRRIGRWALGPGTQKFNRRVLDWYRNDYRSNFARQLKRWYWISRRHKIGRDDIDENLAVGWFPQEVPADPLSEGNAFIFHALGPENGELCVRSAGHLQSAVRELQNIPLYLFIVLREKGAVYYAASLPDARDLAAYPVMRPVGVDIQRDDSPLYAAFYQSVLGQIGFRVDTRVYGLQVEKIPAWAAWYGTAHAADSLCGEGSLAESPAEAGGSWKVPRGEFVRTPGGLKLGGSDNLAALYGPAPAGLVHLILDAPASDETEVNILWRALGPNNYWAVQLTNRGCALRIKLAGVQTTLAIDKKRILSKDTPNSLQILDDRASFSVFLNGQVLFDQRFYDHSLEDATGVGFYVPGEDQKLAFRSLEVHARAIRVPANFRFQNSWMAQGEQLVAADKFSGEAGDLAGTATTEGGKKWRREIGKGVIARNGKSAAQVQASLEHPNPGRTAYTLPWDAPGFADLQVEITPPGTDRGQWHRGRGGLIFWQDAENYLIVSSWLDDFYEGASISSFFHLKGFEDLYDAVWTNVGNRVFWGVPFQLGVRFDGMHYTAFVNDEPVLYRSLSDVYPKIERLAIQRVGIVSNWEWGDDTGSIFKHFIAKTR